MINTGLFHLYLGSIFCFLFIFFSISAVAQVQFVDPETLSSRSPDGSEAAPWRNLQKLIDNGKIEAGDHFVLKSGYYGNLLIRNKRFEAPVKIFVASGNIAKFSSLRVRNSENWHLKGFSVSVSYPTPIKTRQMVEIGSGTRNITIEGFNIFTVPDATSWSDDDWDKKAVSGIFVRGENVNVIDNQIRNVNFGITSMGDRSIVSGNLVDQFSGDGMRGLGDYSVFERNIIKNCHSVNKNHDDGFQSYSVTKDWKVGTTEVIGTVLRKKIFLANDNRDGPQKCKMQGIGMFDGMFIDWVIENNIVIVDHWHGITVMGAKNVRIVNNTVWDPNDIKPGPAWIRILDHKNGAKSQNNLVANNLANKFNSGKTGVLELKNQLIRNPYALFVDPDNFDFRLKPGSRAVDQGMDGLGVSDDYFGNPRPEGARTDVGAVEFQD